MTAAAHLNHPISHSSAISGLLAGLVIGAAIAIAAVAIVGTGGLAAAAIIGGAAAGGAGIGEVIGSMSFMPRPVTGAITAVGSFNVFINGIPAARAHIDFALCSQHSPALAIIAEGSISVFINSFHAARVDDLTVCSAIISQGSSNVFIGGAKFQTDIINPEIPNWINNTIFIAGLLAAIALAGSIVAFVGLALSILGGEAGKNISHYFGAEKGSDAEKWAMLGGSIIGGVIGAKGGAWFDKNYIVTTEGLGSNGGNIRIISNHQKAAFGERIAHDIMLEKGYKPVGKTDGIYEKGKTGIDGIYKNKTPPPDYVITEVKYGSSQLGKTVDGKQMSDSWLTDKRLIDKVGEEEADLIRQSIDNRRVDKVLIQVDENGGTNMFKLGNEAEKLGNY